MNIFAKVFNIIHNKIKSAYSSYIGRQQSKKLYEVYLSDWTVFNKKYNDTEKRLPLNWEDRFPIVHEKTLHTQYDRHYTYHPAWAARVLYQMKPSKHIDIGSFLLFPAIASTFVPIDYYDYRPANLILNNLTSAHADLINLPFADKSIESLSCMHVVEHVGLGRYGDPIDPDGDLKALHELQRVIAVNGCLLVVVPVGHPRIMYNAHRIYQYNDMAKILNELTLIEFAIILDHEEDGGILYDVSPETINNQNYACGCYLFKRL